MHTYLLKFKLKVEGSRYISAIFMFLCNTSFKRFEFIFHYFNLFSCFLISFFIISYNLFLEALDAELINFCVVFFSSSLLFFATFNSSSSDFLSLPFSLSHSSFYLSMRYTRYQLQTGLQEEGRSSVMKKSVFIFSADIQSCTSQITVILIS